jgi:DNA-binding CsgD family transcriptional regulator
MPEVFVGRDAELAQLLEVLAVLDVRLSMAQLGDAAEIDSPNAAVEPAVAAGLVDWFPQEASCPVVLRHALQRDAIYASLPATRRRALHARAATIVDEAASWSHRVAALDRSDEALAAQLEKLATEEAAAGRLPVAATHLRWAADISPARPDRERRFLTAMMHLMLVDEAGGLSRRSEVEATSSSPLRDCVLGTMAFASGQLGEAELRFQKALAEADQDPSQRTVAATIANRLAGTYTLLGEGRKVMELGRRALDSGTLDAAATSQTRTLIAIGTSQVAGPRSGRQALDHLDENPSRIDPVDVDALSFRGVFSLLDGELPQAVADLTASLRLVRRGATFTLGLRAYFYLALAQYFAGAWDDVLLTAEQGFAAAAIRSRGYELPLLHLAAGCVPAGRGDASEAADHVALAEEAAAVLDYGQERLYAGMARALVCQAAGDHIGIVRALGTWQDDGVLDGRSRAYAILWRPLLVEGLIGSGRLVEASTLLDLLRAQCQEVVFVQPALAWLDGWIAEQRELPDVALAAYERGGFVDTGDCPIYSGQLQLAHGRLLRRAGRRKDAIEHLQRSSALFASLRATPFVARVEAELVACGLRYEAADGPHASALTSRETEVAHLVGRGMTNAEVATELFVSAKAVEYHLRNIYAKFGFRGRQELRRFTSDWRTPAPA